MSNMTREEAIQVLKEISTTLKSWSGFTSYPKAIDMAIEALKGGDAEIKVNSTTPEYMQQSPSDGADLISREDVLKLIGTVHGDVKMETDERIKLYGEVCALPSADRPHGEWILCSERLPEDGQGIIICTDDKRFKDHPVGTCIYEDGGFHTIFHDDISIIAWMPLPKTYCPNCDADIRGEST